MIPENRLNQVTSSQLSEDYHQAKQRAVGVLLSIQSYEEAYHLSIRFQCFLGVMKSVWSSIPSMSTGTILPSPLLLPQLHRQLTEGSDVFGLVDPFPTVIQFGLYCLEWLEKEHRYQELLELGRYTPHQLEIFLEVSESFPTIFYFCFISLLLDLSESTISILDSKFSSE